ncbi:MAG TPA: hypothetical protein VFJ78_05985 [Gaiellaceae bacterium]|nr:hypothetical protein [Gaiellaceae bacterium]
MATREERLEEAAKLYDQAAVELDQAAAHARWSARHFRDGEIPRGAAHSWAARGHILAAEQALDEQALEHRKQSKT